MRPLLSIILPLLLIAPQILADHHEPKPLFNGKDLTNWDGDPKFWSVKDGLLIGQTTKENPTKGNTFIIYKGGPVKDFELRLMFKIEGGNSGIQYRAKDHGNWVVGGYQADFEGGERYTGILYEEREKRAIMADVGQKVHFSKDGQKHVIGNVTDPKDVRAAVKKNDWNEYIVTAKGPTLTHKINGVTTIEVIDEDEKERSPEGILALQLHAGPPMKVSFKEITLKELSAEKK